MFLLSLVGSIGLAFAVITEFDDIALDGAGSNPFIRFDDGSLKFIVGFTTYLGFYSGSSYSLNLYESASQNSIVARNGNVGIFNSNPTTDLDVVGDVLISGNLELGSSRDIKANINTLGLTAAQAALKELDPVSFNYLESPDKTTIGFIAEDVPELVASPNRKSINPMNVVAVLTKVVQEQQRTINELSQKVAKLCDSESC